RFAEANCNSFETVLTLRALTTASGRLLANHLSPLCCSRMALSKVNSSRGRASCSSIRTLSEIISLRVGHLRRLIKAALDFRRPIGDLNGMDWLPLVLVLPTLCFV